MLHITTPAPFPTLHQILMETPTASVVLEKYGLDYCCAGKRTLDAACNEHGLDPAKVMHDIMFHSQNEAGGAIHPSLWDTDFLISYIVQNHHRYLREQLPALSAMMTKVVTKHGDRFPDATAIQELLGELEQELLVHLDDEEQGVFNRDRRSDAAYMISEIRKHEEDHDDVGRKLHRLRALTNDFTPPDGACMTHRTAYARMKDMMHDTMQHVFLENALLFPKLTMNESTQHQHHH
jgi:regulator of cell morphogenesis and NO signaling